MDKSKLQRLPLPLAVARQRIRVANNAYSLVILEEMYAAMNNSYKGADKD